MASAITASGAAAPTSGIAFNGSKLVAQGADILAETDLAQPQTLRVFNTTDSNTSPANAEWLSIDWTTVANNLNISTAKAGTGTLRSLQLNSLQTTFQVSGVSKWLVAAGAGNLVPATDSAIDFGSATQHIRDIYAGRSIVQSVGTQITAAATITPTTPIVHVTGATPIATITVPAGMATAGNGGQITLIPDSAFTTLATGNIALASTAVLNRALIMTWDNTAAKWYPAY